MKQMYIDGRFVESESGESFEVLDPSTEEIIDRVPSGNEADAHKAVGAAKSAFEAWRWLPGRLLLPWPD